MEIMGFEASKMSSAHCAVEVVQVNYSSLFFCHFLVTYEIVRVTLKWYDGIEFLKGNIDEMALLWKWLLILLAQQPEHLYSTWL